MYEKVVAGWPGLRHVCVFHGLAL